MSSLKNTFKSITHPKRDEAITGGFLIFAISALLAVVLMFFDSGVTALVRLFIH